LATSLLTAEPVDIPWECQLPVHHAQRIDIGLEERLGIDRNHMPPQNNTRLRQNLLRNRCCCECGGDVNRMHTAHANHIGVKLRDDSVQRRTKAFVDDSNRVLGGFKRSSNVFEAERLNPKEWP
jgi:hypothetical protein